MMFKDLKKQLRKQRRPEQHYRWLLSVSITLLGILSVIFFLLLMRV